MVNQCQNTERERERNDLKQTFEIENANYAFIEQHQMCDMHTRVHTYKQTDLIRN